MTQTTTILGRKLTASERAFARANRPDRSWLAGVLGVGMELASLAYYHDAALAVVAIAHDEHEAVTPLYDEYGESWLVIADLAAAPLAAYTVGPGKTFFLAPREAASSPAAMIALGRPGQPDDDQIVGEEEWMAFGAALKGWLPSTPHEVSGAGKLVAITIATKAEPGCARIEEALLHDVRAAYQRWDSPAPTSRSQAGPIKEPQDALGDVMADIAARAQAHEAKLEAQRRQLVAHVRPLRRRVAMDHDALVRSLAHHR